MLPTEFQLFKGLESSMNNTVYVLVSFESFTTKSGKSFSIEPQGVYFDLEEALDYADELDKLTPKKKHYDVVYDVLEFNVGKEPQLLDFMKKAKKYQEDNTTAILIELMKEGLVDQLIGEDGNFYYHLTKEGETVAKNIPKKIRDMFKKQDED